MTTTTTYTEHRYLSGTEAHDIGMTTLEDFSSRARWGDVVDELLDWVCTPDAHDVTLAGALAALHFAHQQLELTRDRERGADVEDVPAPTSFASTPDGTVCFEWRSPGHIVAVEALDERRCEFTRFVGGRVVESEIVTDSE